MNTVEFHIIPYAEKYHQKVSQLEKGITQGNHIQLEIVKRNFLDRADVFKERYSCIALSAKDEVVATSMGAQTSLKVNGKLFNAGIAFDTKVDPEWRNNGIGRMVAKNIYLNFFQPRALSKNFMIAKQSNARVIKLAAHAVAGTWNYDFVYLTIPTSGRIKPVYRSSGISQQLNVGLFNPEDVPEEYFNTFESGLSYFKTYMVYKLKINKISWLYKQGIKILKTTQPAKYGSLPGENEIFSFVTLYNHNSQNIHAINEVLHILELDGIKQLMVCCRKGDVIFNMLKRISINQYNYKIVSDFSLNSDDQVTIDVRCL